ncbi:hypothetical protein D9619_007312 [Psilocybe cf. subviscida]|uniref:Mitochondrial chaperone BCS1-like ATPase lid domain-containing protein n=1 Tax=Psilocybe cf. subviscida TaxID=2480587 RepID=A0A8H5EWZ2_9AGAR|nr:hypothetical protein D9619_007312 [Psilocybe cf. subviscida]
MPCKKDRAETPGVGPAVTQVLMLIALLAGPFFFLGDLPFENGIRLVILFAVFQATGHLSKYLYSVFAGESTVSKTFVEGKPEYTWIMAFLAQERLYRKFRFSKVVVGGPDMLPLGKTRKLRWNKLSIDVTRTEDKAYGFELDDRRSLLEIKIHTFDDSTMSAFVDEAKTRYMSSHSTEATVHTISASSGWGSPNANWNQTRKMTALSLAIPVKPDVMDSLYSEAREFFDSPDWYAAAGLPWKKTLLLHGVQGTNPLNVVLSLGAKLRRDIYYLNLLASDTQCTNSYLLQALSSVPRGSIFVVENIDQVYSRQIGASCQCCPPSGVMSYSSYASSAEVRPIVTPHGILDCLRGLSREQGILLIGTAVSRISIPDSLFGNGLIDRSIECTLATKEQMVSLFNKFFPTSHGIPHSAAPGFNNLKVPLLADLAEEFAREIPEYSFSLTELQQYLIPHKSSPAAAIAGIGKWVDARLDERIARHYPYPAFTPYNPPAPSYMSRYNSYYPPAPPSPWTPPPVHRSPVYTPPPRIPRPITPEWGWGAPPPPVPYSPVSSPPLSPRPVHPVTISPPSPRGPFIPGITSRTPSPPPLAPPPSGGLPSHPAVNNVNDGWRSPVSPRFAYARSYTPTVPSERSSPAPIDANRELQQPNLSESGHSIGRGDE